MVRSVELRELTQALGIDLSESTAATAGELSTLANTLGIELTELGTAIGFSLGDLANAQSLLNDALEDVLDGLPAEFRDRLQPLLADLENATTEADANAAIAALEAATNALPPEFANQLAPFFAGVDPVDGDPALTTLQSLDETERQSLSVLQEISAALGGTGQNAVLKIDPITGVSVTGPEQGALNLVEAQRRTVDRLDQLLAEIRRQGDDKTLVSISNNTRDAAEALQQLVIPTGGRSAF